MATEPTITADAWRAVIYRRTLAKRGETSMFFALSQRCLFPTFTFLLPHRAKIILRRSLSRGGERSRQRCLSHFGSVAMCSFKITNDSSCRLALQMECALFAHNRNENFALALFPPSARRSRFFTRPRGDRDRKNCVGDISKHIQNISTHDFGTELNGFRCFIYWNCIAARFLAALFSRTLWRPNRIVCAPMNYRDGKEMKIGFQCNRCQ